VIFAWRSNGGPARAPRKIDGWDDSRTCRPEPAGYAKGLSALDGHRDEYVGKRL